MTLVEFQIAFGIIMLVIGGVISSHIFGLKFNEATRAKLSASDAARHALNKLVGDIRSAKVIDVGTGNSFAGFTPVPNGSAQRGSALRIYPGTNTNSYVVYYLDTADTKLKRATNSGSTPLTVAEYLTNTVLFSSESHNGTVLTDNQNNRVIGITMQFYQIRYPITPIGTNGYFDFYQVNTKITRRALE